MIPILTIMDHYTTAHRPGLKPGGDEPIRDNPSVIFTAATESLLFPTFSKLLAVIFRDDRTFLNLVSVSAKDNGEDKYKCWVRHCNIPYHVCLRSTGNPLNVYYFVFVLPG